MFEYSPPLEPWLDILFKDKDIMVVNKPTGLLSVPGRGPENEDSVLHRVKQQHPKAAAAHRLDPARHDEARALQRLLQHLGYRQEVVTVGAQAV